MPRLMRAPGKGGADGPGWRPSERQERNTAEKVNHSRSITATTPAASAPQRRAAARRPGDRIRWGVSMIKRGPARRGILAWWPPAERSEHADWHVSDEQRRNRPTADLRSVPIIFQQALISRVDDPHHRRSWCGVGGLRRPSRAGLHPAVHRGRAHLIGARLAQMTSHGGVTSARR